MCYESVHKEDSAMTHKGGASGGASGDTIIQKLSWVELTMGAARTLAGAGPGKYEGEEGNLRVLSSWCAPGTQHP